MLLKPKKLKNYLKECFISWSHNTGSYGARMTEFIWYWTKGNSKVYTKNTEVAEKAMKEGKLVMGMKVKPNILKF